MLIAGAGSGRLLFGGNFRDDTGAARVKAGNEIRVECRLY